MKKSLLILLALGVVFSSAGMLFAAGVGHNINQSAEFIRMPSRNASTDVDAVFYNPAGTTALANGLHVYVSNQFIKQGRTIEDPASVPLTSQMEDEYTGETNVYLFPNIYAVYGMDQLAIFFGFAPVGGGGTAEFSDGLPVFYWGMANATGGLPGNNDLLTHSMNFEGSSSILMAQIGAAYEITPMVSIAIGGRYVQAQEAYKGKLSWSTDGDAGPNTALASLDNERTGMGYGAIIGVNLKPIEGLNIGIRYEWYSTLEIENDTTVKSSGTGAAGAAMAAGLASGVAVLFPDGGKEKITLPQVIAFGASYQVLPELTVALSVAYALNKQVDHDGAEDYYRNVADIGIGLEYLIMPGLRASIGYQFGMASEEDEGISELSYGNDSQTIGLGARYTIMQGLDVSLGFAYVIYADREVESASTLDDLTLGKDAMTIAIGVNYQIF
jgi:long-chain fatty acid transport protein